MNTPFRDPEARAYYDHLINAAAQSPADAERFTREWLAAQPPSTTTFSVYGARVDLVKWLRVQAEEEEVTIGALFNAAIEQFRQMREGGR